MARYLEQIRPETRMLVIPHIDNMVGFRYPVKPDHVVDVGAGLE